MKSFLWFGVLSASAAFAQPVPGTWSGYVTGWVQDTQRFELTLPTGWSPARVRRPALTQPQVQYLALQQLSAQQLFFAQQNAVQLQDVAARQQVQLALQQEAALQQRRAEREQQLTAEAQLLATQQQLAIEQQQLAQQQQQAAADERARLADREARVLQLEAEQKLLVEREASRVALSRAQADSRPREKGPDIHRWVDRDGVVHYSTRPQR